MWAPYWAHTLKSANLGTLVFPCSHSGLPIFRSMVVHLTLQLPQSARILNGLLYCGNQTLPRRVAHQFPHLLHLQLIPCNPEPYSLQVADNGIHRIVLQGEGGGSTSSGLGGRHGPRRKILQYQFPLLGHGPLFVAEFHLGVLLAHFWL
jgi:hypothetical protein